MAEQTSALTLENARDIGLPTGAEWKAMLTMGSDLVGTGFLPNTIRSREQAAAIMLKGMELRIPPMLALSNIVMVKGKPTVGSELMLGIIYRDHGKRALRVKHTDNTKAVIEYRLDGWEGTSELTFTIDDARQAGLVDGENWKKYPAVMLRWRAISQVAKIAFPETIGGMYVAGELGERVIVEGDNIISAPDAIETTGRVTPMTDATPAPTRSKVEKPQWVKDNEDDPARLHAIRALHAIAKERDIDHDMLHAYALTQDRASLSLYSTDELNDLSNTIHTRDVAVLKQMFGDFGWTAPQWMVHQAVVEDMQPRTVDQETGEIIDVTPATDETARYAAKRDLWNATKGWGWSLEDLEVYAAHNAGKPLGEMTREEYEGLLSWLNDATPEGRAEELANAHAASGKAA